MTKLLKFEFQKIIASKYFPERAEIYFILNSFQKIDIEHTFYPDISFSSDFIRNAYGLKLPIYELNFRLSLAKRPFNFFGFCVVSVAIKTFSHLTSEKTRKDSMFCRSLQFLERYIQTSEH